MSVAIGNAPAPQAPPAVLGDRESRVLFLGLGGTGKEVLSRLKQRLFEVNGGQLPPSVALFAIDVDSTRARKGQPLDPATEFYQPVAGLRPLDVLEEVRRHQRTNGDLDWIAERVPPDKIHPVQHDFTHGTERYRQVGLLAFLWAEIGGGIRYALEAAVDGLVRGAHGQVALQIFLVSSVCGGTGSGMLLDAALLARSIGLENAAGCDVSAVLLLPGVFRSAVKPKTYQALRRNALATLTELEYYMYPKTLRRDRTCNPLDVDWAHRSAFDSGPFDLGPGLMQSVFLIDNQTNSSGSLGGIDCVVPAVADVLLHISGAVIGDRLLEPLNNARAEFRIRLQQRQMAVDLPHFSSLGLARIVLPVDKLALEATPILSAAVLERVAGVPEMPPDAVVVDALRALGFGPGVLADELGLTRPAIVEALINRLQLRPDVRHVQRIDTVSARIGEIIGQRANPEDIRRPCLAAIQAARGTLQAPGELARQRGDARQRQAEEHVRRFVNAAMTAARENGRGLRYLPELLDAVLGRLDVLLTRARLDSNDQRADIVARAASALDRFLEGLDKCGARAVRNTALKAGRAGDKWLNDALDYQLASAQGRIYEHYQTHLRTASRALRSLLEFLEVGAAGAFDGEVARAIALRIVDWELNSPITDINIQANGQDLYLAASDFIRDRVTDDCVASLRWSYDAGRASLAWTGGVPAQEVRLTVTDKPDRPAQAWVKHLETFTARAFAGLRLDDHISDSQQAELYAHQCGLAAKAFIRYNLAVQAGGVGQPVEISVVAPPAGTKLVEAFRNQTTAAVAPQNVDPTSAVFLTAVVGLAGKALQFSEQASVLETSTVGSPGLWLLGQVSYNVFWYQHDRWNDLELFFASLAADRIIRREIPGQAFANPRGGRYNYYLVLSESQETKLGNGIEMAILKFCGPDEGQHRIRLREENAQRGQRQLLSEKKDEFLELIDLPGEVPSENFRRVLQSVLETIEPDQE